MGSIHACSSDGMEMATKNNNDDSEAESDISASRQESSTSRWFVDGSAAGHDSSKARGAAPPPVWPQRLPDPRFVSHVTMDQHLVVVHQMQRAEARREQLAGEATELRRILCNSQQLLQQKLKERDYSAYDKNVAELQAEKLVAELAEAQDELARSEGSVAASQHELAKAAERRAALEAQLRERAREEAEVQKACQQHARTNAALKKKLQSMRGTNCAECKLRSREADALGDFFADRQQQNPGTSIHQLWM